MNALAEVDLLITNFSKFGDSRISHVLYYNIIFNMITSVISQNEYSRTVDDVQELKETDNNNGCQIGFLRD